VLLKNFNTQSIYHVVHFLSFLIFGYFFKSFIPTLMQKVREKRQSVPLLNVCCYCFWYFHFHSVKDEGEKNPFVKYFNNNLLLIQKLFTHVSQTRVSCEKKKSSMKCFLIGDGVWKRMYKKDYILIIFRT